MIKQKLARENDKGSTNNTTDEVMPLKNKKIVSDCFFFFLNFKIRILINISYTESIVVNK